MRRIVAAMLTLWAVTAAPLVAAAEPQAAKSTDTRTARTVFGAIVAPSPGEPQAHGGYALGCLAGGRRLAPDGPGWQAMRPSRNRAYGHPALIAFIERLGLAAQEAGWPGVLVGDMAQPQGGPMRSGHRSHQSGIDVDIWLRPAPEKRLSTEEREQWGSPSVVAGDRRSLRPVWTPTHARVLRAAAEDQAVARIFVNPAVKAHLCATRPVDQPSPWLRKIRPWWGHASHFHVRLRCPAGSATCVGQDPPPPGEGCDAMDWWFSDEGLNPKPGPARPEATMADLPPECRALVRSGG